MEWRSGIAPPLERRSLTIIGFSLALLLFSLEEATVTEDCPIDFAILAGDLVPNVGFYGLAKGIARGGLPSARIAVYKVCSDRESCNDSDVLAGFDDAIANGVDIISISLAATEAIAFDSDSIAIGVFHVMKKGILTSHSIGNDGPSKQTTVLHHDYYLLQQVVLIAISLVRFLLGMEQSFSMVHECNQNPDAEFAYGAGHIDPVKVVHPGLVYVALKDDYIKFLCNISWNAKRISIISGDDSTCLESSKGASIDLNYPSVAVHLQPNTAFVINFPRRVTNVGSANATYKASFISDSKINISVKPRVLSFTSLHRDKSFMVTKRKWGAPGFYGIRIIGVV
ncbi:hypothetical protein NE237_005364 [Protea cynaroides]|uniref:Uncharacterized protein n=1 Tax=Protea cynaroides TaxID=273540 RepID=A0A9Q0QU80_9MAGN|nr:hypothetical protein NE237_005364 [Protea cynaroides]